MRIKIGTKYKVYIDVLMSALFFSLAHISFQFGVSGINFSWPQLVSPFLMGSCIGMVYKKTDSVWICMIIHGIVNIVAVTV
ncbi:MAG TPA: CPBP family intramembrane metalloprotease [Clostridiaceae bacterium]|nr:CPBP family intramembrane metalloprotease [Clostridiaceae bacterium]